MQHRIPISGAPFFNQTLQQELQTFRVAAGQAPETLAKSAPPKNCFTLQDVCKCTREHVDGGYAALCNHETSTVHVRIPWQSIKLPGKNRVSEPLRLAGKLHLPIPPAPSTQAEA